MKYYEFKKKQFINLPVNEVFDFFSNPENLEKVTPEYLNFKINTKLPLVMGKGQFFDYQLRVRGIPVKWTSIISFYDPPHCFIDEQIKGPYSSWQHIHTFTEKNGGTSINDFVKYSLPLGYIGQIINSVWVKKDLKNIFKYRRKKIPQILKEGCKNYTYKYIVDFSVGSEETSKFFTDKLQANTFADMVNGTITKFK